MVAIYYIPILLLVCFITFILFCAVMHLRNVRDDGLLDDAPVIIKAFAYLTLFVGLVFDVLLNVVLSVVLVEPPLEWLTTDRMKRLKSSGNRWQKAVSNWMCAQLGRLDFNHCGE